MKKFNLVKKTLCLVLALSMVLAASAFTVSADEYDITSAVLDSPKRFLVTGDNATNKIVDTTVYDWTNETSAQMGNNNCEAEDATYKWYMTFNIKSSVTGTYNLKFAGLTSNLWNERGGYVVVNGEKVGSNFKFTNIGNGTRTEYDIIDVGIVNLVEGNNTITIRSNGKSESHIFWIELNSNFDITSPTLAEPKKFLVTDDNASSTGTITTYTWNDIVYESAQFNGTDTTATDDYKYYIDFTITSSVDSVYGITLVGASGYWTKGGYIIVNGNKVDSSDYAFTRQDSVTKYETFDVGMAALNAGTNTIRIMCNAKSQAEVFWIELNSDFDITSADTSKKFLVTGSNASDVGTTNSNLGWTSETSAQMDGMLTSNSYDENCLYYMTFTFTSNTAGKRNLKVAGMATAGQKRGYVTVNGAVQGSDFMFNIHNDSKTKYDIVNIGLVDIAVGSNTITVYSDGKSQTQLFWIELSNGYDIENLSDTVSYNTDGENFSIRNAYTESGLNGSILKHYYTDTSKGVRLVVTSDVEGIFRMSATGSNKLYQTVNFTVSDAIDNSDPYVTNAIAITTNNTNTWSEANEKTDYGLIPIVKGNNYITASYTGNAALYEISLTPVASMLDSSAEGDFKLTIEAEDSDAKVPYALADVVTTSEYALNIGSAGTYYLTAYLKPKADNDGATVDVSVNGGAAKNIDCRVSGYGEGNTPTVFAAKQISLDLVKGNNIIKITCPANVAIDKFELTDYSRNNTVEVGDGNKLYSISADSVADTYQTSPLITKSTVYTGIIPATVEKVNLNAWVKGNGDATDIASGQMICAYYVSDNSADILSIAKPVEMKFGNDAPYGIFVKDISLDGVDKLKIFLWGDLIEFEPLVESTDITVQ